MTLRIFLIFGMKVHHYKGKRPIFQFFQKLNPDHSKLIFFACISSFGEKVKKVQKGGYDKWNDEYFIKLG